ncbi:uncharacterized protein LOC134209022 [Armigeres subalbatus]|uniref:uncharacterized protein LOC134209022 n=1 Tax=Armigeres subalbatus TaxID=124917 RepID=UPI002ED41C8B
MKSNKYRKILSAPSPSRTRPSSSSSCSSKLNFINDHFESRKTIIKEKQVNEASEISKQVLELYNMHHRKFQNELVENYDQYIRSKTALDQIERESTRCERVIEEPNLSCSAPSSTLEQAVAKVFSETDQLNSGKLSEGCPLCESRQPADVPLEELLEGKCAELSELNETMKQLEEKCCCLETEFAIKQKCISALEDELTAKAEMIETVNAVNGERITRSN